MLAAGFLAVFAAGAALLIKKDHPQAAMACTLASGALILLSVFSSLSGVAAALETASSDFGLPGGYVALALKLVGISYITEFASQSCKDCGENALAQKTELAGRIALASLAVPVLLELCSLIGGLL